MAQDPSEETGRRPQHAVRVWPEPLPQSAVDTHGHLSDPAFADDLQSVWERAQNAGVRFILDPGVDLPSSRRAMVNAHTFGGSVRAAVGIHPHEAASVTETGWRELEHLAASPEVVAIGEIGLDAYREISPLAVQERVLLRCLALAQDTGRPVLLHVRGAYARMLELLGPNPPVRGVVHAFWGDRSVAEAFLARGFVLGFGGAVTFRRESALREVVRSIPAGGFVLETDMPYLAPYPVRGSRCESALIAYTARALADVRGEELHTLLAGTTGVAARLFPIWTDLSNGAV
jgi:TatD DNase family protein